MGDRETVWRAWTLPGVPEPACILLNTWQNANVAGHQGYHILYYIYMMHITWPLYSRFVSLYNRFVKEGSVWHILSPLVLCCERCFMIWHGRFWTLMPLCLHICKSYLDLCVCMRCQSFSVWDTLSLHLYTYRSYRCTRSADLWSGCCFLICWLEWLQPAKMGFVHSL